VPEIKNLGHVFDYWIIYRRIEIILIDVFLVEDCVDPWIIDIRSSFSNNHGSWEDFILSRSSVSVFRMLRMKFSKLPQQSKIEYCSISSSGFSVSCCINKEVICYQLELGK